MALPDINKGHAGLAKFFKLFGSVRADELRVVYGAFLTLLGFMTGHAILETARDALFLAELPVSLLPWVYMTLAASALLITRYHPNLTRYLPQGHELTGWLVFAATTTALLWLAIFWSGDWIFYVVYAWTGVLATLVVIQFWTLLGNLFTVTQAKRLYAVIGTGSILGAILGSGLSGAISALLPTQHLVLCAAIAFGLAAIGPRLMLAAHSESSDRAASPFPATDFGHAARLIIGRPYLKRLALAVLLATTTFTLVDFVFKSTVARMVPDESLGTFFSTAYFSLNLLSLILQVTCVAWILRKLAVSSALAIVPLLLLAGSIGFMLSGGLVLAVVLKGLDGSLRYSLYRTTTELLFVPISSEVRGRVKSLIDLIGQRGGQVAGSVIVLIVLSLTTNEALFALIAAVAAGAWLYLLIKLKPHYLELFRATLREDLNPTRIEFPALDVASLETLLFTLNSSDDRQVVAALDLLEEQGRIKVVPGLILYHPSSTVVTRAVEQFAAAGRIDVLPLVDRLAANPDGDVRAAGLRARTVLSADRGVLEAALDDTSSAVRATAAIALVAHGWRTMDEIRSALDDAQSGAEPEVMLAVADSIRVLPNRAFDTVLLNLTGSTDTKVQLAAVKAMSALGDSVFIEPLSRLLANRALRVDARAALVALGTRALTGLSNELSTGQLPHAVRRHIPHTIAAFGTPQAASVLLRHLLEEGDGMIRFKVLRALGRMRSMNTSLPLDSRTIKRSIDQNLESAFRYMRWKNTLAASTKAVPKGWSEYHKLLIDLLHDKESHTLQRLFRLLNLRANDDEFLRIYRGLHSSRREARASGRELIELIVEPVLARQILAIIDDLFEPAVHTPSTGTPQDAGAAGKRTLIELVDSGTESLSSLAALAIGRLQLVDLRAKLESVKAHSPSQSDVLRSALKRLDAAEVKSRG